MKRGYLNKVGKINRTITKSIKQFGAENHTFEVIEVCNIDELRERERYWQEYYNCLYPNGLNRNLVACKGKRQQHCEEAKQQMSATKMGGTPWNKGLPTWESTKKTIKDRYCPLTRSASKIILDTRTGVYYYCLREASQAFRIPKQTLKMNLSAPNKDCKKNKTHLIYT